MQKPEASSRAFFSSPVRTRKKAMLLHNKYWRFCRDSVKSPRRAADWRVNSATK